MNKLISLLLLVSIVSIISACSEQPRKTGSTPDEQRANAEKGHRDLSSEVKK